MREFLNMAKALSDPARVRVLAALRGGELCLCHFIALLGLSPSTVSKHLDILYQAGLVERRKAGRWCYFRLAGRGAPAAVRGALRWVETALANVPEVEGDAARVTRLRKADVKELACCYKAS
ncbi:MAG: metalloregulator ArsR/SmtB family transcription factor [Planctomycetota bacterium]